MELIHFNHGPTSFSACFSVNIMKKKLDPENLGIILLHAFMDEFYPKEESSTPDTFTLMHYNGLIRSNPEGKASINLLILTSFTSSFY